MLQRRLPGISPRFGRGGASSLAYTEHDMHRSSFLLTTLALSGPLALAQTTAHHTTSTTHRATHTTAKPAGPVCAVLPPISPKIPALPASVGCPKTMFTVADRLDYIDPIAARFKTTLFSELPIVISLDYAEITLGTGELAKPQQYYTVKYTGYLIDGSKFDSSEDHEETKAGFTFPYGAHRVIAGWDLGFEGMRMGGKRRLYIPYQFAYGAGGQPPKIPPKSMLIFDMELLSQSDQPPKPPTPPTPAPGAAPTSPSGAPASPGTAPGAAPTPAPTTPPPTPDTKPQTPAPTPNPNPPTTPSQH